MKLVAADRRVCVDDCLDEISVGGLYAGGLALFTSQCLAAQRYQ